MNGRFWSGCWNAAWCVGVNDVLVLGDLRFVWKGELGWMNDAADTVRMDNLL